ncbi:catechol 2,3-dioxygenase-like lactoylglutathione lyase family enzyme [Paraburkholderia sp. RAU6.4a]|uniref:VOC family protein n=1 Tax=Paraburkholderia sp. RAU6.4a TaxID=2991067 RepID=UPI003D250875
MSASNLLPGDHAAVAIHSIDHFALTVPDLEAAEHFFSSFGLDVCRDAHGLELRATDGHRWGRIFKGERKALAYLSVSCFERDFASLRQQLEVAGAVGADRPPQALGDGGVWFRDLDGNLLELKVGPKTTPFAKEPNPWINVPSNVRGSPNRAATAIVKPRRLSHVLLFTPDVSRALEFYRRGLGVRLSDRSQDIIAFSHAPHGSDHHLIAFVKSSAKGWHHSAWEVDGVDEVGLGAAQMSRAGYHEGWGTGRHVLGSNYFHYVRDPWGSFSEYSAHIDYVDAGVEWPAGDHAPEDSLYLWGPDVPPYFIVNTEID